MAMLNKTKLWRKLATKTGGIRTGKMIRNILRNKEDVKTVLPIHIWLMKRAGISTPVYDAAANVTPIAEVVDVEGGVLV